MSEAQGPVGGDGAALEVSSASSARPRVKVVECPSVPDADGNPLRVLCEAIPELQFLQMVQANPGLVPEAGAQADDAATLAAAARVIPLAVEAGTALRNGGPGWIRPAFSDDPDKVAGGSIPMRWVSETDRARMFQAIMELTGYWGAALKALSFPGENREGLGDGGGTVAPGKSHGHATP